MCVHAQIQVAHMGVIYTIIHAIVSLSCGLYLRGLYPRCTCVEHGSCPCSHLLPISIISAAVQVQWWSDNKKINHTGMLRWQWCCNGDLGLFAKHTRVHMASAHFFCWVQSSKLTIQTLISRPPHIRPTNSPLAGGSKTRHFFKLPAISAGAQRMPAIRGASYYIVVLDSSPMPPINAIQLLYVVCT